MSTHDRAFNPDEAAARSLAEVLSRADAVDRNRGITSTYFQLARQVDEVIGNEDANWLTFGTWASASAGRFIRGEDVPGGWGADAVAEGNSAIIADIAPRFLDFIALARSVPVDSLATSVAARPALTQTAELAEAFECYARAAGVRGRGHDDVEHAQLVLRANTLIAHHEQRLADDFVDRALPLGGPFGMAATVLVSVSIPQGRVPVGQDIPRPAYLDGAQWPRALDMLSDPRLVELARAYGQDVDSVRRSNATSWEDFGERMGFIFCFFRAFQRDPDLRMRPAGV